MKYILAIVVILGAIPAICLGIAILVDALSIIKKNLPKTLKSSLDQTTDELFSSIIEQQNISTVLLKEGFAFVKKIEKSKYDNFPVDLKNHFLSMPLKIRIYFLLWRWSEDQLCYNECMYIYRGVLSMHGRDMFSFYRYLLAYLRDNEIITSVAADESLKNIQDIIKTNG